MFGKDRASWQLRCQSYVNWRDKLAIMETALVAGVLRAPSHGCLPGRLDPRNGLPLAVPPPWLAKAFALLRGAVVYTFTHCRMVRCSPETGTIGVCVRHCYLCISDEQVLFMSEAGQVVG